MRKQYHYRWIACISRDSFDVVRREVLRILKSHLNKTVLALVTHSGADTIGNCSCASAFMIITYLVHCRHIMAVCTKVEGFP